MSFLYFLEGLRTPVFDTIFSLITLFGEETLFMAVGMICFWCINKYQGYYLLCTGFVGTVFNQFLKILCRIPRPWVIDPDFTIVESARDAATGYSFPSGHTQTAVGLYGGIARSTKAKWLRIVMIALALLVGLSRMYLGVHTPADVLVGAAMAIIMVWAMKDISMGKHKKQFIWLCLGMLVLSIAFLIYLLVTPRPEDHNYASALKNAYTFLGCFAALPLVWLADEKKIHFSTKAVWWAQILKAVLGLGVGLLVKEGLRSPLEAIFAGHLAARAVRYFLIVVVAGILWPLTFCWFGKLGRKAEEAK
jgi:undecaprenyl-diphosphatase